jgi:hypothetical protein
MVAVRHLRRWGFEVTIFWIGLELKEMTALLGYVENAIDYLYDLTLYKHG